MINKTFFISDTHFYHKNVIEYCNRPFSSLEEMHKTLINNWNKVVSPMDKVFVLGDFSFGNQKQIKSIFDELKGNKILIKGNHDRHNSKFYIELGFKEVFTYSIIWSNCFILSHYPIDYNYLKGTKFTNIHGHIHQKCINKPEYINISVEQTKYSPILLSDILLLDKEHIV